MKLWEKIEKVRNENKDNQKYPKIYWSDYENKLLYVKVGDFEKRNMTLEQVISMFKNNKFLMDELEYLLESRNYSISEEIKNIGIRNNDFADVISVEKPTIQPVSSSIIRNEVKEGHKKIEDVDKHVEEMGSLSINDIKAEIEVKISDIIEELGLIQSNEMEQQLKNCCLVQKYIVEHVEYEDDMMAVKAKVKDEDMRTIDLYNALIRNFGVCTSNSIMFQEILTRVGVKVECVGLTSTKDGGRHMANLVELDGEYYFFDSTFERSIYDMHASDGKGLILCCAGLGIKEYCEYYRPEVIMPLSPLDKTLPLPKNISLVRLPAMFVNKQLINDESSKKSKR